MFPRRQLIFYSFPCKNSVRSLLCIYAKLISYSLQLEASKVRDVVLARGCGSRINICIRNQSIVISQNEYWKTKTPGFRPWNRYINPRRKAYFLSDTLIHRNYLIKSKLGSMTPSDTSLLHPGYSNSCSGWHHSRWIGRSDYSDFTKKNATI